MESKRIEFLTRFYGAFDEDGRLCNSAQGKLEYLVTMDYVHRYLFPGCKVIELGAGTGKYSVALAKEGYDTTAVELVESNLEVLKQNGAGLEALTALQGDATDLSRFADGTFDVTLVFGPMYHLYEKTDVQKAIDEAIRITKKGGVVLFAFLSIYAIMYSNYMTGGWSAGQKLNFTDDFRIIHEENQLFTGYDVKEFEALFADKPTAYITTAGTDFCLEAIERRPDFSLSGTDFEDFLGWYKYFSETRELLGLTDHLLYICKKK